MALQSAVRTDAPDLAYATYAKDTDDANRQVTLRGQLCFTQTPVALARVAPVEAIVTRFHTGPP